MSFLKMVESFLNSKTEYSDILTIVLVQEFLLVGREDFIAACRVYDKGDYVQLESCRGSRRKVIKELEVENVEKAISEFIFLGFNYEVDKVDEICTVGQLEKYRDIVIDLVRKFNAKQVFIFIRTDSPQSTMVWRYSRNHHIVRVSLKVPGLPSLWKFIHEYGHFLDGEIDKATREEFEWEREVSAWNNAKRYIETEFPQLLEYIDSFENEKRTNLESYSNK